ncbi:4-nitrophenylphosphatase-like [Tribolium madens]|uniref:4-nitrophenylphosphatase-like n=1 Tax=Tribolium madens TaxID=41895 RepID=UPI001CF73CDD|nr:4-nitrophenylphosphatase-like [Tribolium madens]
MKDLRCVSKTEQKKFFDSFDQVLCDVDGVLWHFPEKIPGADLGLAYLKNLKKQIIFVSNKTTKSQNEVYKNLKSFGFDLNQQDLIMPQLAVIWYLEKINFNKKIFLLGMTSLKVELEDAGFEIVKSEPGVIPESVSKFFDFSLVDDCNIGAVVCDTDVNLNYLQLQKAGTYLKRSDTLFITTNGSRNLYSGTERVLFGPGYFDEILENFTGRKALRLAKPSLQYNEFIKEKFQLRNTSRVLFIGDSIEDDMAFASNCGYKKLLVLSGNTHKNQLLNWKFPDKSGMDYYVDSLKVVHDILSAIY